MKIIITCHSYYPRKDGVQFVTQYLAEGLVKKGNEVVIYTNYHSEVTDKIEEIHNGVTIKRIDAHTKHTIHFGKKEEYIQEIIQESKNSDCMINVCTQCATTDWILKSLDKINIPKILYLHSIWDFEFSKNDFKNLKTLFSKIWCNIRWGIYYNVNSNSFKKYNIVTQLHQMDYTTDFFQKKYNIKSVIIENAAEESFFDSTLNNQIDLPQNYILNVSNYLKRKNQMKCLELFLNSEINDDWKLILIGSQKNSYYDKLQKKYDEYKKNGGKKEVRLLYNIPRNDISTYVKKAKVYLMTSKWEAFPISLVESLAASVPFISSDVGIIKFLPGGVTCKNDKDYYYWINKFCNDEEFRTDLGKLGNKEAIRRFSVSAKVEQLNGLIKEICKNGSK